MRADTPGKRKCPLLCFFPPQTGQPDGIENKIETDGADLAEAEKRIGRLGESRAAPREIADGLELFRVDIDIDQMKR